MKLEYPIAVVHCRDQSIWTGVYDPRIQPFKLAEMVIVGHLLHDDEDRVVLALEYFDDHEVRYTSSIPRENITKMEILREQDKD